ncbi:hypothetical protein EJ05DRAFT_476081 [Pseudovirgaria hyperparasitica]|uniref:DUF3253 domain-containing protein n=1 Tax=Pseudovirgaria hyperparasitica TaxID=470096 RepID=A0A6A6W798_9PEZI|nr:uncharacterized protein EJ05DRAFT_476081 [Pseudovirgaria hyperparasitica]KAF2758768.1 hypothetical protein EJ05DRAFT_476081 [Pseudovirgaria hyperparasitica]
MTVHISTPISTHLQTLLSKRAPPKTLCPSEVARALSSAELQAEGVGEWRELMPRIRDLVWQMRDEGEVEILQRGEVLAADVGVESVIGPIRVRRKV